ncbi:MAG: hypothetical protein OHK0036_06980 [Bacteroidia bacterium]
MNSPSKKRLDLVDTLINFRYPEDQGNIAWGNKPSILPIDNIYELLKLYIFGVYFSNDLYFYGESFHDEKYNNKRFFIFLLIILFIKDKKYLKDMLVNEFSNLIENLKPDYYQLEKGHLYLDTLIFKRLHYFFNLENFKEILDKEFSTAERFISSSRNLSIQIKKEEIIEIIDSIFSELKDKCNKKLIIDFDSKDLSNFIKSNISEIYSIFRKKNFNSDVLQIEYINQSQTNSEKFSWWFLFDKDNILINNSLSYLDNFIDSVVKFEQNIVLKSILKHNIEIIENADNWHNFKKDITGNKKFILYNFNPYFLDNYKVNLKSFSLNDSNTYIVVFEKNNSIKIQIYPEIEKSINIKEIKDIDKIDKETLKNKINNRQLADFTLKDSIPELLQALENDNKDKLNKFLIVQIEYEIHVQVPEGVKVFTYPAPKDDRSQLNDEISEKFLEILLSNK